MVLPAKWKCSGKTLPLLLKNVSRIIFIIYLEKTLVNGYSSLSLQAKDIQLFLTHQNFGNGWKMLVKSVM